MRPKTRGDRTKEIPRQADVPPAQHSAAPTPGDDERFRIISELTSDFAYAFTVEPAGSLKLEWMTDAFARITGYRPDEVWPDGNWLTLIHPADQAFLQERLRYVLAGRDDTVEARILTRDGATRWLSIYSRAVTDPALGRVTRVYGAVQDITARKQAEAALQESEARYRSLAESAQDAIFIINRAGRLEYINQAAGRVLHRSPEEVVDKPPEDFFDPGAFDRQRRNLQAVFASGRPAFFLGDTWVGDQQIWQETSLIPLQDEGGSVRAVMGIARDVTDRVRAEEALRESEERYRSLAESTPDAIYIIDRQGRVEYVNRAAAGLVGCDPAAVVGRQPEDLFAPGTFSRQAQNLQRVLQSGQPLSVENRNVIAGRAIWQHSLLVPLKDRDGLVRAVMGVSRDITERKRTEEALRQSEHQYRSTIDSMRDIIHVVDPELRIILCNAPLLQWLQEAAMDTGVVGRTVFEVFPFLPAAVRDEYMRVFESGEMLLTEETSHVGERDLVTETRKIPVFEEGRVARVITVVHDITKRKRAEVDLRESEERYRTLVETSPDGITLTDLEGRILMVNRRTVEVYGAESDAELIGRNSLELISPPGRERAVANIRRALETGFISEIEYDLLRKDGTTHPVELTAALLRDAQGRPQAFIGVTRDITERKRAEEVLWQTKMVVEHSPVILYRLRAEAGWPFEFVSENVALSGYTAAELVSGDIPFAALVHPEDLPQVLREMEEHIERGPDTFRRSYRSVLKNGQAAWVEDRVVVVRGPDGPATHIQGILLDVTENRRLEEQFRQAQKMETVGRLAGGIAHDFNNFLTAIRGYTGLVYDALHPEDPVRADVEQVRKAAERAASLTAQLLAFSRRQIIEPRPVNLNDLVMETEKMLRRLIGEDIDLGLDLTSNLGLARADPSQIAQALVNLVINARDAMPDGGVLTITTANMALAQDGGDEHVGVPPGEYVTLTVSDTGMGMAPEVKAHLFEPFFTTKEAGQGTGLGLATVYGIVKQHQGYITIQSEPGRGTMARICLPVFKGKVQAGPRRGAVGPMPRGSETVLVVEDEPAVRALIVRVLRGLGYNVLEAGEGNAAIQTARGYKGPIDLLLTDVVMPQMDGKMLASLLQDAYEGLRVLYVSGYATDVLARYGILDEGVFLLHKPFTGAELADKVREVLDP